MASKMVAATDIPTISVFFCHRSAMFWPIIYAFFQFNGWSKKCLGRTVSTVDMVTSNIANV